MTSKIFCNLIQLMLIPVLTVHALPAQYCLYPLNKTDCGLEPTPVFSYYKSGSRCEIEIWRGCPSYNRFESQTTCHHYCIGRFNFAENEISDDVSCEGKLNNGDCGAKPTTVYTYNHKTEKCEEAQWKGCKTSNIFDTETKCKNECMQHKKVEWADTISKLSNQDINDMNKLIDEVLKEPAHDKLKNVVTAPPVTEAATEQSPTEAPVEEEPAAEETKTATTPEPEKDKVDEIEYV